MCSKHSLRDQGAVTDEGLDQASRLITALAAVVLEEA